MAPFTELANLVARQVRTCPSGYHLGSDGYCYNNWTWWGRWVFLAVLVVFFIAILGSLACIRARRRRQAGVQPYYGTGWMAPGPKYGYNNNNPGVYQPPPPPYPQQNQYTGNTFNPNDGYYGNQQYGQQEGIQLQQPTHSYQRGGENVYEPPTGPPPKK